MKKLWIILFLTSGLAWADGRLGALGRIGDDRYTTSVSHEELQQSSHWSPSDGAAPVGQLEALKKARAALEAEFPEFGDHQVVGVTLAETSSGAWLYKVAFLGKPAEGEVQAAGGHMKASMLTYFVLLNGKTISPEGKEADPMKKVELKLQEIDAEGLRGPVDGKVAVSYEFVIPDTERHRQEVKKIDSTVSFMAGSKGRIGAKAGECLCIGSTHQKNHREVLRRLAELPYVERIIECFFE